MAGAFTGTTHQSGLAMHQANQELSIRGSQPRPQFLSQLLADFPQVPGVARHFSHADEVAVVVWLDVLVAAKQHFMGGAMKAGEILATKHLIMSSISRPTARYSTGRGHGATIRFTTSFPPRSSSGVSMGMRACVERQSLRFDTKDIQFKTYIQGVSHAGRQMGQ